MTDRSLEAAGALKELPNALRLAQVDSAATGKSIAEVLNENLRDNFPFKEIITNSLSKITDQSALSRDIQLDAEKVSGKLLGPEIDNLASATQSLAKANLDHATALGEIYKKREAIERNLFKQSLSNIKKNVRERRAFNSLRGRPVDVEESEKDIVKKLTAGANLGDVTASSIQRRIVQNQKRMIEVGEEYDSNKGTDADAIVARQKATEEFGKLQRETDSLNEAFKILTDASGPLLQSIKDRIQIEQTASKQRQTAGLGYAYGTDQQRQGLDMGALIAMSGMELQDVPSEYRSNLQGVYREKWRKAH